MAGRAPNACGNAAGRYNLRPRGRFRLRGAAALADSPLLGRLLGEWSDVFDYEVLSLLNPTARALLGRVGQACRDAVLRSSKPPCTGGTAPGVPLKLSEFVGSVRLLGWARKNGCPWNVRTCQVIAQGGHLEVLQMARERGCQWDDFTTACAVRFGHLELLQWARVQGCPWWEEGICNIAAQGGHLAVMQWLRDQDCPWGEWTCACAATYGHLAVLQWARAHGCPWDSRTRDAAVAGGHLEVIGWLDEQGAP